MNGQLIILLLTLLVQSPSDSPVYPTGRGGSAGGMGQKPIAQYGYGVDQYGKYCMVIQIPPDRLLEFAKGDQGEELFTPIPVDRRNDLDGILFRVGTGQLPNSPPPPKLSNNPSNDPTILTKLSQIDNGPNANLSNASQNGNPGVFPNTVGNADSQVLPPSSNSPLERQRFPGNSGLGVTPSNNIRSGSGVESLGQPQSNNSFNDDSSSKSPFAFFKGNQPNSNTNQNNVPATNPLPYGNSVTGQNYGSSDNTNRSGQNNSAYQNNGPNPNGYPTNANSANQPQNNQSQNNQSLNNQVLPANSFAQPNMGNNPSAPFYNQPPLVAQVQNPGLPPQTQSDFYG